MKPAPPACAVYGLLIGSRNLAADDAVLRALPQMEIAWRSAALEALLQRDRANAFARLICQFNELDDDWKGRLAEHAPRLAPGIRSCIESTQETIRLAAVALLRRARSSQLAYLLVDALCRGCPNTAREGARGLLELASETLQSAEHRPQVIAALTQAICGWNAHRREEVLLACALCAEHMLDHLDELAADPRKPVGRALKRFIREAETPRAAGLVLRALAGRSLADAAREKLASTGQPAFVRSLLDEVAAMTDVQLCSTCSRIRRMAWLDDASLADSFTPRQRHAAIRLVHACSEPASRKIQFIRSMELEGDAPAAQCAIDLLAGQNSDDARHLLRTLAVRRQGQASRFARQALMSTHAPPSASQPPGHERPDASFKVINEFWQQSDSLTPADRTKIARALDELGPDFARFLQHHLARGSIVEQLRAIGIIGDSASIQRFELDVQRAARHPDPLLRAAAIEQLSRLDGPATRRIIRDALHDPDHRVQASAIETIERLNLRDYGPQLNAKLDSPNNRVRANAIKALLRFGQSDAGQKALAMLQSSTVADRLSGVWVVHALQRREFIERLRQLAEADADVRVRRRAEAALARMQGAAHDAFRRQEEVLTPCG